MFSAVYFDSCLPTSFEQGGCCGSAQGPAKEGVSLRGAVRGLVGHAASAPKRRIEYSPSALRINGGGGGGSGKGNPPGPTSEGCW